MRSGNGTAFAGAGRRPRVRFAPVDPDDGADERLDDEFERFFVTTYDGIVRSLAADLGDHDAAVDAAQEGFIRAHEHWAQVRTYDQPAAWVRRSAVNASRDRLRSDRRRRARESAVVVDPTSRSSAEPDVESRGLLDELPQRQREVATRFYVEDHSVEQIAAELGVSVGTVKSQLSDARARLRRHHQR